MGVRIGELGPGEQLTAVKSAFMVAGVTLLVEAASAARLGCFVGKPPVPPPPLATALWSNPPSRPEGAAANRPAWHLRRVARQPPAPGISVSWRIFGDRGRSNLSRSFIGPGSSQLGDAPELSTRSDLAWPARLGARSTRGSDALMPIVDEPGTAVKDTAGTGRERRVGFPR
jgi:hypothetical protein